MNNICKRKQINSSFRDPSGFVFFLGNVVYRQINYVYKDNYNFLVKSELLNKLQAKKLLINHLEVDNVDGGNESYKIIKPEQIDFISYPYEWCFSQLRAAALVTLEIQKISLEHEMTLKDASAYNIQFKDNKAVFIDTLSFEKYEKGKPWIAYKQFCQHFLAPLALMYYTDARLNQLFRMNIDGIPLDLATKLLPVKTRFNLSILTHIHLQAKMQNYFSKKPVKTKYGMDKKSLLALIDNLEVGIRKMKWQETKSEWGQYYNFTNYSNTANKSKRQIIEKYLHVIKPKNVWDLGANNGEFSRIASSGGAKTFSFDIDYNATEKNYTLFIDLSNPSSAIGWAHEERMSLLERGPADVVFALALVHHLAISNNLPFDSIAKYFKAICNYLIIEFIPKTDSKVQKLLSTREDIFHSYNQESFEKAFEKYFSIKSISKVQDSERVLYLMKAG